MNINELKIKYSTVLVQIVKDLPNTINTDIITYLIMQGGYQNRSRIFAFDKGEDLGRKLFYYISMGYVETMNIHALNAYVQLDKTWADTEHHVDTIPAYTDDDGLPIDEVTESITNSMFYNNIVINDSYYVKLNDVNLPDLIIDAIIFDNDKAINVVFELPIISE